MIFLFASPGGRRMFDDERDHPAPVPVETHRFGTIVEAVKDGVEVPGCGAHLHDSRPTSLHNLDKGPLRPLAGAKDGGDLHWFRCRL